ncbi:MAG: hypothetical protein JWM31_3725 [Solirubrobacterales bacterium]|nr:hypothetical protein [Solirubrobacterales bacterium]
MGLNGRRYQMRADVFDIGEDYWIEDDDGNRAFKVDGKAMRLRKTLVIEDATGAERYTVQERKLTVRDTLAIERDGDTVAKVRKALIGIGDRYVFEVDGDDYKAKGKFLKREYEIEREGETVAEIDPKFFALRDTYGIEIAESEDPALIIAAVVCIEELAKDR